MAKEITGKTACIMLSFVLRVPEEFHRYNYEVIWFLRVPLGSRGSSMDRDGPGMYPDRPGWTRTDP